MTTMTSHVRNISPPATPLPSTTSTSSTTPTVISGAFFNAHVFSPIYQRNNKKGNIKNLRCFPACSSDAHKQRGFCGRSVLVNFTLPTSTSSSSSSTFHSFIEFVPVDEPAPPAELDLAAAARRTRTKQEPMNAWLPGLPQFVHLDKNKLWFEFNGELKGWHYSWESNKHKCDTKHHLRSTLYERRGGDDRLVLVAQCVSPEFILFCRRRKRFALDPGGGGAGKQEEEETPITNKRARSITTTSSSTSPATTSSEDEDDVVDDGATDLLLAFMHGSSHHPQ